MSWVVSGLPVGEAALCACVCVRECVKAMILIAQYSVISHLTHTYTIYAHTHTNTHTIASSPHTCTQASHSPSHAHRATHTVPLGDFLFLFFTSTLTVIKAYIASAPLSRAKWFVMICVDIGILFPLWKCSLDSAFSCGSVRTAGAAFVFATTLSVYKSGKYCTPWRELGELCRLHPVKNKYCMLLHNGNQPGPHHFIVFVQLTSWLYHVSVLSIIKQNMHKIKLET